MYFFLAWRKKFTRACKQMSPTLLLLLAAAVTVAIACVLMQFAVRRFETYCTKSTVRINASSNGSFVVNRSNTDPAIDAFLKAVPTKGPVDVTDSAGKTVQVTFAGVVPLPNGKGGPDQYGNTWDYNTVTFAPSTVQFPPYSTISVDLCSSATTATGGAGTATAGATTATGGGAATTGATTTTGGGGGATNGATTTTGGGGGATNGATTTTGGGTGAATNGATTTTGGGGGGGATTVWNPSSVPSKLQINQSSVDALAFPPLSDKAVTQVKVKYFRNDAGTCVPDVTGTVGTLSSC